MKTHRLLISAALLICCFSLCGHAQQRSNHMLIDPQGHADRVNDMALTPDGRQLITVSNDKSIRVWEPATGRLLRTLRGYVGAGAEGNLYAVALSPDGRWLVTGGYGLISGAVHLHIYDFVTGRQLKAIEGFKGILNDLQFSPDGQYLVNGSEEGLVSVWRMAELLTQPADKARPVARLKAELLQSRNRVAFSPDGQLLAAGGSDGVVSIWRMPDVLSARDSARVVRAQRHRSSINSLAFTSQNNIISGANDGLLCMTQPNGDTLPHLRHYPGGLTSIALSPDRSRLFAGYSGTLVGDEPIEGIQLSDGHSLGYFRQHSLPVLSLMVLNNDLVVSAGGIEFPIYVWQPSTGNILFEMRGAGLQVQSIAFAPDNTLAFGQSLVTQQNKTIYPLERALRLDKLQLLPTLADEAGFFRNERFFEEKFLDKKSSNELHISNGTVIKTNSSVDGSINDFCFTPDGRVVVACNFSLKMYDDKGQLLRNFTGHSGNVLAITISRDGRLLASASADQTIKIWSLGPAPSSLPIASIGTRNTSDAEGGGAKINFMQSGSTAQAAGLQVGDVVTALNGISISSAKQYADFLLSLRPGSQARITLRRGAQTLTLAVPVRADFVENTNHTIALPLATFFVDTAGEWVLYAEDGYYTVSSPKAQRYLGRFYNQGTDKNGRYVPAAELDAEYNNRDTLLARLFASQKVRVHSTTTPRQVAGEVVVDHGGHSAQVRGILFTPDGKRLVSYGVDKTVRIWDLANPNGHKTIRLQQQTGSEGMIYGGDISPDGQLMAVAGYFPHYEVRVIDLKTQQVVGVLYGHNNTVTAVAFSADGQLLASGGHDGTVKLYNLRNIRRGFAPEPLPIATLRRHSNVIYGLQFAPDGSYLVSGADDSLACIWPLRKILNREDYTPIELRKHQGSVGTVAITPNSQLIYTSGGDDIVHVWNREGQHVRQFVEMPGDVNELALNATGTRLVIVSNENYNSAKLSREYVVYVYDTATGQLLQTFRQHDDTVLRFGIHGDLIATAGGLNYDVYVWNMHTGQIVHHFVGAGRSISGLGYDKQRHVLAVGNSESFVDYSNRGPLERELHLATMHVRGFVPNDKNYSRIRHYWQGHTISRDNDQTLIIKDKSVIRIDRSVHGSIRTFGFSPGGNVIVGCTFALLEFDIDGRNQRQFMGHQGPVNAICFSTDGRYMYTAGEDQVVLVWDMNQPAQHPSVWDTYTDVSWRKFFAQNKLMGTARKPGIEAWYAVIDALRKMNDTDTTMLKRRLATVFAPMSYMAGIFIGSDNEWVMWQADGYYHGSPKGLRYIGVHQNRGAVRTALYTPIVQLPATLNNRELLHTRLAVPNAGNATANDLRHEADFVLDNAGHNARLWGAHFRPGGQELVTAGEDKTLRVWDVKTGRNLRTLRGQTGDGTSGYMYSAISSPDGKWLAVNGSFANDEIRIIDYATGQIVGLLMGMKDYVNDITYSPDGNWLAATGNDNTIRIWDLTNARRGHPLPPYPLHTLTLPRGAADVAFFPGGRRMLASGRDSMVYVFNLDSLHLRRVPAPHRLALHTGEVSSVAVSPDGRMAFSVSYDGLLVQWDPLTWQPVAKQQFDLSLAYVAVGPDNKTLTVSALITNKRIYQAISVALPGLQVLQAFNYHTDAAQSIDYANARTVATAGGLENEVFIWDVYTGHILQQIAGQGKPVYAAGLNNERRVAFGNFSNKIDNANYGPFERSFDLATLRLYPQTPQENEYGRSLWYHRGKTISFDDENTITVGDDKSSYQFDARNVFMGKIYSYTFLPNGQVAVGMQNGIVILDTTGQVIKNLRGHIGRTYSLQVSDDGKLLTSASFDQTIRFWNLEEEGVFPSVFDAFSNQSWHTFFVSIGMEKEAQLRSPQGWQACIRRLEELKDNDVNQLRTRLRRTAATISATATLFVGNDNEWVLWGRDGYYAASAQGARYLTYHINRGPAATALFGALAQADSSLHRPDTLRRRLGGGYMARRSAERPYRNAQLQVETEGHRGIVWDINYSADGKYVVSYAEDKTIRVWDAQTGKLVRTIYTKNGVGIEGSYFTGSITPNGKYIAAAGWLDDETTIQVGVVRIFELATGRLVTSLPGSGKQSIKRVRFSPDGNWLGIAADDGRIYVYNMANVWRGYGSEPRARMKHDGHDKAANDLAWSADSRQLITVASDSTAILWDLSELQGGKFKQLKVMRGFGGPLRSVDWSADGKWWVFGATNGKLSVWSTAGQRIHQLQDVALSRLAIAPDSRTLAVGAYSGSQNKVHIFDIVTGQLRRTFAQHDNSVRTVAFSGNQWLASGGGNAEDMYIWDVNTGLVRTHMRGTGESVQSIAFNTDAQLALGTATNQGEDKGNRGPLEKLFNLLRFQLYPTMIGEYGFERGLQVVDGAFINEPSGQTITTTRGDTISLSDANITAYSFMRSGQVVVADWSGNVFSYDKNGIRERVFDGHVAQVNAISMSPDGKLMLTASADHSIKFWNLRDPGVYPSVWQVQQEAEWRSYFVRIGMEREAKTNSREAWLAVMRRMRDLGDNTRMNKLFQKWRERGAVVYPIATLVVGRDNEWVLFCNDGYYVASARGARYAGYQEDRGFNNTSNFTPLSQLDARYRNIDTLRARLGLADPLWRATLEAEIQKTYSRVNKDLHLVLDHGGHTSYINDLTLSTDSKRIFTASFDKTIREWDLATGLTTRTLRGQRAEWYYGSYYSALQIPGSDLLLAAGITKEGSIRVFDLKSGDVRHLIPVGNTNTVLRLEMAHRDAFVAAANYNGEFAIWDLRNLIRGFAPTDKPYLRVSDHSKPVNHVLFSPDDALLAAASDDSTVTLHDAIVLRTAQQVTLLKKLQHAGEVRRIVWSADGQHLITASSDGRLLRWTRAGTFVDTVARPGFVMGVLKLSPDGTRILVAGDSARGGHFECHIYAYPSGQLLRRFTAHNFLVNAGAYINANLVATAGGLENEILLWDPNTGAIKAKLSGKGKPYPGIAFDAGRTLAVAAGSEDFMRTKKALLNKAFDLKNMLVRTDGVVPSGFLPPILTHGGHTLRAIGDRKLDIGDDVIIENVRGQDNDLVCYSYTPNGKYVIIGSLVTLKVYDRKGMLRFRCEGHNGPVYAVAVSADGRYMASSSLDQTIRIWDLQQSGEFPSVWDTYNYSSWHGLFYRLGVGEASKQNSEQGWQDVIAAMRNDKTGNWNYEVVENTLENVRRNQGYEILPTATLFLGQDNEWVMWAEDGYFAASKKGSRYIGYHVNRGRDKAAKLYPFEQFDLKFNRRDVMLKKLGIADTTQALAYFAAYLKRLSKMGLGEQDVSSDIHLPEVLLYTASGSTAQPNVELSFNVADTKYFLDRVNVYVNDVPIYGAGGYSIKDKKLQLQDLKLPIQLAAGRNKVQVSVMNDKGAESLRETILLYNQAVAPKPTLYVVTIGVSKYKEANYNLTYAAKDATDLRGFWAQAATRYAEVRPITLVNEAATRENILALKKTLMQSHVDDEVILFVAGHGLLDDKLDYYFATHDVDFNNPAARGLEYGLLESLLDGIPARRKLLLMDTCHSGEVDKEEVQLAQAENTEQGAVKFRSAGRGVRKKQSSLGLKGSFELMQELFADLRRGSGAMVISSAGGAEYALEGSEWNNGVFTYSVLQGMKTRQADLNKDGSITVQELNAYVSDQVSRLTQGRQRPTSRRENLEYDYRVW